MDINDLLALLPTTIGASNTPATPSRPGSAGGIDMAALLRAFTQISQGQNQTAQQRLGLQDRALFGRHLGIGGGEMTPSNPTGNPADPWSSGGLFRGGFRAQIGDRAADLSSGNTAVNQWKYPSMFHGGAPNGSDPAEAAVGASPQAPQLDPSTRSIMGLPPKQPNLFDFFGLGNPNPTGQPATARTPANPRPQPSARSRAFGASASPRSGFSF